MVGRDQFPLRGIECRFEGFFSRPSTKPRWTSWLKWEGAQVLIQPRWTHTSRHDEWNQILDNFCHVLMYWKLFLGHLGNTHLVCTGWSSSAETSFQASCSQPARLLRLPRQQWCIHKKNMSPTIYACTYMSRPNLQMQNDADNCTFPCKICCDSFNKAHHSCFVWPSWRLDCTMLVTLLVIMISGYT